MMVYRQYFTHELEGGKCVSNNHHNHNAFVGDNVQSFHAHRGPVYALCMAGPQRVLTSGADPLVVQFELTTDSSDIDTEPKWVMTTTRTKHTHDVRALLSTGQHIVSAGKLSSL